MRKTVLPLFLLLAVVATQAQTNLDSLYAVWQNETLSDSSRVTAYKEYIGNGFLFSNPDTAIILSQALLTYGKQHNYPRASANAYNLMGLSNSVKSDYPKALDYFQRSSKIFEEIGDKNARAGTIGNIGTIYAAQGDYTKTLDYFQRCLKIFEEMGDKKSSSVTIGNIGLIYADQGESAKALDYYQRSLKIFEEIGDKKESARIIMSIGNIYGTQGDYPKALDNYQRSLKIFEEFGNNRGSANAIYNIGNIYALQGDKTKALDYYERSLKIFEELGDKKESARTILRFGTLYFAQGDFAKALDFCKKALITNQEIGALKQEKEACQCLYDTYKAMGKGNEALAYLEKLQVIDDSLNAEETTKTLQQMEFAKQMLADSLQQEEDKLKVEMAHQKEVAKKERTRNWAFAGGGLLLLLAIGLYSRNRYVRKAKNRIEKEKDRSENLLLNILPAEIAEELKEKGEAAARNFDMVSILFTDFKGFTQASEKLSASDLVAEINTCFKAFDGIVGKYNIEKIKTIGDAYMAAGGLPVPDESAAQNTVLAGLDMQAFMKARKTERDAAGLPAFEMRVGIHTGPVVAGIVGVKKFQYDIWGDTVNTASRMESSSEVGQVNISEATYELLKADPSFAFESRGKIDK